MHPSAQNQAFPDISKTAIWVAAGRAVGAREPDRHARNPDYLAEQLLGDPSKLGLDHPVVHALRLNYDEALQDSEVVNTVRSMTVRTRFIDEALEREIDSGATQLVILGAGYDSHAYRFQDRLASALIFEVDRPAMQALKRQRVNEVLGGPPSNLTYVGTDFQDEDLVGVLNRHGYDQSRRTFFIMEGVSMYLSEVSLKETLRFAAVHAPGSAIVFDFVYGTLIDLLNQIDLNKIPPPAKQVFKRFQDTTRGEPWVFGFPLDGEREYLAGLGLKLREVLPIGGDESIRRYLTRADGSVVGAEVIAEMMTHMTTTPETTGQSGPWDVQMTPERMQELRRLMAYQLAEAVVN